MMKMVRMFVGVGGADDDGDCSNDGGCGHNDADDATEGAIDTCEHNGNQTGRVEA